jgi:small conductance mechanosensitive channel
MRSLFVLAGLLVAALPVFAQEETASEDPAAEETVVMETRRLPAENAAEFESRLAHIEELKDSVAVLETQLEGAEGLEETLISARLDTSRTEIFQTTLGLAQDMAAEREKGFDVSEFQEILLVDLRVFPDQARAAIDRLADSIEFNYADLGPQETVINDRKLLSAVERVDEILATLITYTEVAKSMNLDATEQLEFINNYLSEGAANRSVFLEVALDGVVLARNSATTLPEDPELLQWVAAAEARVGIASAALQSNVDLMNRLGLDTRRYRQQIVTATGELTTDVLDVGVIAGIVGQWTSSVVDFGKTQGPKILFRLMLMLLILLAFFYLAKLVQRGVEKALSSSKVRVSHLLKRMIVSTARNLVILLGMLIALSQIGISLGPLLAGLGIAGFIIGFALQDTLSNFASGMMILIYRPFDVGDFVEGGGVTGRVDRMSLVNTTFKTLDNQVIVVPNNMIWQNVVVNVTAQRTRRVDLTFGISYDDDIDKAKEILWDVINEHEACLDTPEPNVVVGGLGESSVDLYCRPWVRTDDYWPTYWGLTEIVKKRFDEAGITIPYPQRDVHMIPRPESQATSSHRE